MLNGIKYYKKKTKIIKVFDNIKNISKLKLLIWGLYEDPLKWVLLEKEDSIGGDGISAFFISYILLQNEFLQKI